MSISSVSNQDATLPKGKRIARICDEVEKASLHSRHAGFLDTVLTGIRGQQGKLALESCGCAESLHDGNVGQTLASKGRGRGEGLGHHARIFAKECTAKDGHEQESWNHGCQHARQFCLLDEGDDEGSNEKGDACNENADFLRRAGLYSGNVAMQTRRHILPTRTGVKKGGWLAEESLKVNNSHPMGEPLGYDAPDRNVGINEHKCTNCDVNHKRDLLVNLPLVVEGIEVRLGSASSAIQFVDELTENDGNQRERRARGNGKEGAGQDEDDIEPCRLRGKQESEENGGLVEELVQMRSVKQQRQAIRRGHRSAFVLAVSQARPLSSSP